MGGGGSRIVCYKGVCVLQRCMCATKVYVCCGVMHVILFAAQAHIRELILCSNQYLL